MKDSELKERLLTETERIAQWLQEQAKTDEKGIFWESMSMDLDRNISWEFSESIYSGVAGIALFFLELSKLTGKEHYRNTALESMRRLADHCLKKPSEYHAFFTGRMGVPYALIKMTEATGDSLWTEKALEIAKPAAVLPTGPSGIDDLINGSSGTTMGFLHLHAATGEPWLLEALNNYTGHLLDKCHHGSQGLYWDRSTHNISGLCGFSHGAAGIGWVFLELGHYFQNETFYRIAQQAFHYESHYFDETVQNWRDLRKGIFNDEDEEEHRQEFLAGNLSFFTEGGNMNAWCHGAAGIGLSRLRAVELFKDVYSADRCKRYEEDAKIAIETTRKSDALPPDPDNPKPRLNILCHGGGGNAELFIRAYETFNDPAYLTPAEDVARYALDAYREKGHYLSGFSGSGGEDTSLFMGTAGIGYFYLRLMAPGQVPSLLAPHVNAVATDGAGKDLSNIGLSPKAATRKLVEKTFRRSLLAAEQFLPQPVKEFFDGDPLDVQKPPLETQFIDFMDASIPSLPPKKQNCLSDIFTLEREKVIIDHAVIGSSWLHIKERVLIDKAKELTELEDDEFVKLSLVLEADNHIATTDWNWYESNAGDWADNINLEPDVYPLLIKPTPFKVLEEPLSPLSYTILGAFDEAVTVTSAIKETIEAFEALTPEQEKMLTGKIIAQVKQALLAGILAEGATPPATK